MADLFYRYYLIKDIVCFGIALIAIIIAAIYLVVKQMR